MDVSEVAEGKREEVGSAWGVCALCGQPLLVEAYGNGEAGI
jgi:hypothetical protein